MVTTGYILVILGCIACLVGEILMLTIAYKRGLGWFLGSLVLAPIIWLMLLAVQFKPAAKAIAIIILGAIVSCVGARMSGLQLAWDVCAAS